METAWDFRRRRSAELKREGASTTTIARYLGVTPKFVRKWHKIAQAGGCLKGKRLGGRPRKLSLEQLAQLEALLLDGPVAHGWENNLWTSKRVAEVIRRHFGVHYEPPNAWVVLTKYLGWTLQRPIQQLQKRDDSAIDSWKMRELPRILKETGRRRACLVFIDESGFMLSPTIRQTFAPCGRTPVNKVSDPHGRISVIGAVVTTPAFKRFQLIYDLLPDNANFRADNVLSFVNYVQQQLRRPMTVLWDAIPIHRARRTTKYLAEQKKVVVEWFPPYAPELNPVDKVWFHLKFHRMGNYAPTSIPQLRARLKKELENVRKREELIRSCVRRTGLGLVRGSRIESK